MGLLDLPSPLFSLIDSGLSFLPATVRLVLWALIAAAASMYLYLKSSRQDEIAALKTQSVAARKALNSYEGTEFDEMMPLATRVLSLSAKHFLIVLGPAVLSSLTGLMLIVWASNQYGAQMPAPGSEVRFSSSPPASLVWSTAAKSDEPGEYRVVWPPSPTVLRAYANNTQELFAIDNGLAPVIHKKTGWNWLVGNPAGYLPDDTDIEQIDIELEMQQFLPVGPPWMREWAGLFFAVLLTASIAIKFIFRIN